MLYAELFPTFLYSAWLLPATVHQQCRNGLCELVNAFWQKMVNKFNMEWHGFHLQQNSKFLVPKYNRTLDERVNKMFKHLQSVCPESPNTLQTFFFTACANSHCVCFKKAFVCGFYLVIFIYIYLLMQKYFLNSTSWK